MLGKVELFIDSFLLLQKHSVFFGGGPPKRESIEFVKSCFPASFGKVLDSLLNHSTWTWAEGFIDYYREEFFACFPLERTTNSENFLPPNTQNSPDSTPSFTPGTPENPFIDELGLSLDAPLDCPELDEILRDQGFSDLLG